MSKSGCLAPGCQDNFKIMTDQLLWVAFFSSLSGEFLRIFFKERQRFINSTSEVILNGNSALCVTAVWPWTVVAFTWVHLTTGILKDQLTTSSSLPKSGISFY